MKQFTNLFLLLILVLTIAYGNITLQASMDALTIWFEKLVPSMFVTLVLIRTLYHQNILEHLYIPFLPRLFHMDSSSFSLVLCCMFLGFPNGALLIDDDVVKKRMTRSSAQRLLYTCSFPAPGFVILSCGTLLFQSLRIGILLFIAQILSCLLLLWLTAKQPITRCANATASPTNLIKCLSSSIWEAGKSLYLMGGYLMVFMSVSSIFTQFLPNDIALPLRIISELSSGTLLLQTLPYSIKTLEVLTCLLLSFGGLCVHMQVYSMAHHIHFSYVTYAMYRILQSCISTVIFLLLLLT